MLDAGGRPLPGRCAARVPQTRVHRRARTSAPYSWMFASSINDFWHVRWRCFDVQMATPRHARSWRIFMATKTCFLLFPAYTVVLFLFCYIFSAPLRLMYVAFFYGGAGGLTVFRRALTPESGCSRRTLAAPDLLYLRQRLVDAVASNCPVFVDGGSDLVLLCDR